MAYQNTARENILKTRVLNLSDVNEQKKRSQWTVNIWANKPQITVWTGIEGDIDNKRMSLTLSPTAFNEFIELIRYEASQNDWNEEKKRQVIKLDFYQWPKNSGKKNYEEGPPLEAQLWVGRDEKGIIFISLIKHNRPRIRFRFKDDIFKKATDMRDNPIPAHISSNIIALAYANTAQTMMNTLLVTEYVPAEERPQGNNNYSKKNNNNNNYSRKSGGDNGWGASDSSDDDDGFNFA